MSSIREENKLGRCFLHRTIITKGLLKEKDYKCVGCNHALKYERPYWRTSSKVKAYLKLKGIEFIESQTKKGHPTLITKKVKEESCIKEPQN